MAHITNAEVFGLESSIYRSGYPMLSAAPTRQEFLDSVEEIRALAQWLASVSPDIPLHLSRFFPRHQMQDRPPTPVERVYQLAEEARNWLAHVYTGNC